MYALRSCLNARPRPMGVPERLAHVLFLGVTGYTFEDHPISHQRIWIPETPNTN